MRAMGHVVRFDQDISKKIREKEAQYKRIFPQAIHPEFPQEYMRFVVGTSGKTEAEAGTSALDALDHSRAIWNLQINIKQDWRMSSGRISPVNKIVLGPLHTLFTPDRHLVESIWWQDHGYDGPIRAQDVSGNWESLRKYERKVLSKVKGTVCKDLLKTGFLRYVRALDGRDYESVFLKLWSVLEHLTLTKQAKYDVTIRRAAFVWKEPEFQREVLHHLRESRNLSVHSDKFGDRGEALVYQLKRYVEALLKFHIGMCGKFKSLNEIELFLDLPPSQGMLAEKKQLIREAIRFRST